MQAAIVELKAILEDMKALLAWHKLKMRIMIMFQVGRQFMFSDLGGFLMRINS